MVKRQRSNTSEDADGSCKGKRLSSELGRPTSVITSPLLSVSESSQSDNEVDIVWGHSPPPMNLNLLRTPGPKTRRKSDHSNRDIADMIECIHSRNSSQQSPTVSTPPLLGLWMQGRQDFETTPVGGKGQRLSRRLPSRKPSNEAWASLAKDLHMLVEASKDFPLSQQPAAPLEAESENIVSCQTDESLHKPSASECQTDPSVTPNRCPSNHVDVARDDSPMTELWGDDSWFETDSVLRIATQLEEQEASKKLDGVYTDSPRTGRGNDIPPTTESSGRNFEPNENKKACEGFQQTVRGTNASSLSYSNQQFTSPPNCRRLSTKKMFQTSSEGSLKKEIPSKGRASFRFTVPKESSGLKTERFQQFSKQSTDLQGTNSVKLDERGNTQTKEASATMRGKSQFAKSSKHDNCGKNIHPEMPRQNLATSLKKVDASATGIANPKKILELDEEVSIDCNESIDLFESSLENGEVDSKVQKDSRRKEGGLNSENIGKGVIPFGKANQLESDMSSDLSFIDEELLAAVEKEEMDWEEISSQKVDEVVKTSETCGTDKRVGYQLSHQHQFATPHPRTNTDTMAAGGTSNQTTTSRKSSSQFSFKSSQKDLQRGVQPVMKEQKDTKSTSNSLSTLQTKSSVSGIACRNDKINQNDGKHVNQFSIGTSNKKAGKQFERTIETQFSSSQSVQFQPNKSGAKVVNGLTRHKEKLTPATSNNQVSSSSSNFSPFKAPASSQFVKSSTSGPLKDCVSAGSKSSSALSEKNIVNVTQTKKQAVNPTTTSNTTSHPVGGSIRTVPETVLSDDTNNAVLPLKGSRDSFQLGTNLPERKGYGQTKSAHLSQFASRSKDTKTEKTSNSNVTLSRGSLKNECNPDTSSISRTFGMKTSSQFQSKSTHIPLVSQVASKSDLNSSTFSHVSSQFSSSSQVKLNNDTCSQVTPSPIFTSNAVRPSVTNKSETIPQPPETGTVFRKAKEKETLAAATQISRNIHHNQFSQFSKAKKEHSVLVDPSVGESFPISGDVSKEEGVHKNHSTLIGLSGMSKNQKIPSFQLFKAGNSQSQSSSAATPAKSILSTVTNVYVNDGKKPVVSGNGSQFSKVSRTSSTPSNGQLISFQNGSRVDTEPREESCDSKLSQKAAAEVNLNTTNMKSLQGNSTACTVIPQRQTSIVTTIPLPSQDKRPCSQEQIEQKRRVALARKKQRENLVRNHGMNLRERTFVNKK